MIIISIVSGNKDTAEKGVVQQRFCPPPNFRAFVLLCRVGQLPWNETRNCQHFKSATQLLLRVGSKDERRIPL